jgi:hypothetical protein
LLTPENFAELWDERSAMFLRSSSTSVDKYGLDTNPRGKREYLKRALAWSSERERLERERRENARCDLESRLPQLKGMAALDLRWHGLSGCSECRETLTAGRANPSTLVRLLREASRLHTLHLQSNRLGDEGEC